MNTDNTDNTSYPILPLRDIIVFPNMVVPLFVGRKKSVLALEDVMKIDHRKVILLTQKKQNLDDPKARDLYNVGVLGKMLQFLRLPDGTVKILIEGLYRVKVKKLKSDGFMQGSVTILQDEIENPQELEILQRNVLSQFEAYVKLSKKIPPEVLVTVSQIQDPSKLTDTMASYFSIDLYEKQKILELTNINKRLEKILSYIESELTVLQMEKNIRTRVKKQMEKTQKEYYLNEQLKAIQSELQESEQGVSELDQIKKKIKTVKLSPEAKEKAQNELKKLYSMNAMSSEAGVIRNYLDWLLGIPWNDALPVCTDLQKAREVLDEEHYGLEKVKDRILEYLAVQSRVKKMKGQILCLVGPPGVGKTSLGKTIAKVSGRTFTRMALGGVRDESEIRGHRRTYIGALPGKIIQGMRKARTSNPLFLLDEIDKMGQDWRGDPASALLEVLDPEQNAFFNDHYLEVDYDLSDVMFVTTANTLKLPQPLLDRMEIIRIAGYSEDEKLAIAKKYLFPKQLELHGLKEEEVVVSDDIFMRIIRDYTREAGVRSLEREIAKICRKTVKTIATGSVKSVSMDDVKLREFSGAPHYHTSGLDETNEIGISTGLAWTEVGGEVLSIETLVLPGTGKIAWTGKLGDVMQESVQTAYSYVKSCILASGMSEELFTKNDIHVHVPEGAVPKDGPSAGTAIATSIYSAISKKNVRKDVAMTGEITLLGRVLQIGGLKEKLLAAQRYHIKTVLIPKDNIDDLDEIPENVKKDLDIIPVSNASEVFNIAIVM